MKLFFLQASGKIPNMTDIFERYAQSIEYRTELEVAVTELKLGIWNTERMTQEVTTADAADRLGVDVRMFTKWAGEAQIPFETDAIDRRKKRYNLGNVYGLLAGHPDRQEKARRGTNLQVFNYRNLVIGLGRR